MKAIRQAPSYRPPSRTSESPVAPTELEVQSLWFEQLYANPLSTDDGRTVEIIQPGFWNHGAGPDFQRAVVRFSTKGRADAQRTVGHVEVHLRAADWQAHGHDVDPNYEGTILHVVWESARRFFPATVSFRSIPQIVLQNQLVAPWTELAALCGAAAQRPMPTATPGRCSPLLSRLPAERVGAILRAAGMYRAQLKGRRWFWRGKVASREQALYEAIAEALGFHANQIPMRLVAQRLPWKKMRGLSHDERLAHLFGLGGFLPEESLARLPAASRTWLRRLWELWWKARGELDFALLERQQWKLAGLRPLNRPERRLAALAQIVPRLPKLLEAVEAKDDSAFADLLLSVRDEFWEHHATLTGAPLRTPCRLIGEERVHDMLINIFWPMVGLDDEAAAQQGLRELKSAPSSATRVATQRMLLAALTPSQMREALIQQGLLQIFRDYCQTDCSQCRDCAFPDAVAAWSSA
jgi:hypothetical protein